jgi:hypothetical protein
VSTPKELEPQMDLSTLERPVLLLEVPTPQLMCLNISRLCLLLLNLSTLQWPSTHWGLSFVLTCLHYRFLCCTWTGFLYRVLSCIWTCLDNSNLCCSWNFICTTETLATPGLSTHLCLSFTWMCLHYRALCSTWTCFLYRGLSCTWMYLHYRILCCT